MNKVKSQKIYLPQLFRLYFFRILTSSIPSFSPLFTHSAVELMKSGSYLTLTNAKIDMVRGNMRLAVPQNSSGKIEAADGASFEPKIDNNMSLIEYELVPLLPEGGAAKGKEEAKIEVEEVAA